jgi:hypothetical protein
MSQECLVGRAQWETKQTILPEETTRKLGGSYLINWVCGMGGIRREKRGQPSRPPARRTEEGMGPDDLLCSRNARPQKDEREWPSCPSCSQNAHDKNVLARCAQSRTALATPFTRDEESWKALARANGTSRRASGWAGAKVARSGRSISPHP